MAKVELIGEMQSIEGWDKVAEALKDKLEGWTIKIMALSKVEIETNRIKDRTDQFRFTGFKGKFQENGKPKVALEMNEKDRIVAIAVIPKVVKYPDDEVSTISIMIDMAVAVLK